MTGPLDHHHADRVGLVRAARLYSNLVSPPTMFAVLGLALAWRSLPFWPGLAWAAVYGFFVSLAPILLVLFLLHKGRIAELHMTNTHERHLPYLGAAVGAAIAYAIVDLARGPELLRCLSLMNIITLVALFLINVIWLISIHATAITAAILIAGIVFGWPAGLALVPLLVSVAWVRLYLHRHNLAQVIAGMGLGAAAVYGLALTGCFVM